MNPIKNIINIIDENDFHFVKKNALFYIIGIILTSLLIQLFFIWKKNTIKNEVKIILEKNKNIIKIINKKIEMVGLTESVKNILTNKEQFRLKDYVNSVLSKNNFSKYLINQNENVTEQKFKKDYLEYSMNIELINLSTQEVLEILAILENDIRIYLKNISIKNMHTQKVSLSLSIATIKLNSI